MFNLFGSCLKGKREERKRRERKEDGRKKGELISNSKPPAFRFLQIVDSLLSYIYSYGDTVTIYIFDDTMSFEEHVIELCRTAFFHIRNISRIRPCLSIDSTKTLVHTLVTSRLDYRYVMRVSMNILFKDYNMS